MMKLMDNVICWETVDNQTIIAMTTEKYVKQVSE